MEKSAGILERFFAYPGIMHPLYRWIIGAYIYRGYQAGLPALIRSHDP